MQEMITQWKGEVQKYKTLTGEKAFALVIDDNLIDRVLRKRHLQQAGFDEVDAAATPEEAMDLLTTRLTSNEMYAVICSDYRLSPDNNYSGARVIADMVLHVAKYIPVILQRTNALTEALHETHDHANAKKSSLFFPSSQALTFFSDNATEERKKMMEEVCSSYQSEYNQVSLRKYRAMLCAWNNLMICGITTEVEAMKAELKSYLQAMKRVDVFKSMRFISKAPKNVAMSKENSSEKKNSAPPASTFSYDPLLENGAITRRHTTPARAL